MTSLQWQRPLLTQFTYPASIEVGTRKYGNNLSSTNFAISIEQYSPRVGISIIVRESSSKRAYYFNPYEMHDLHITISDNEGVHFYWTAKSPPLATGWPVDAFGKNTEQSDFVHNIGQCRFFNVFTPSTGGELVAHLERNLCPLASKANISRPETPTSLLQKNQPTVTASWASRFGQQSSKIDVGDKDARKQTKPVNVASGAGEGFTSSASPFGRQAAFGKSDKSQLQGTQTNIAKEPTLAGGKSTSLRRGATEASLDEENTSRKKARVEAGTQPTPDACAMSQSEHPEPRGSMVPFPCASSVMPDFTEEVADAVLLGVYTTQSDVSYWMGLRDCDTVVELFDKVVTTMIGDLETTSIARLLVKVEEDATSKAICLVPDNTTGLRALQRQVVKTMKIHGQCTLHGEVILAQK